MKVFLASLFAALLVAPALHAAEVVLEDDAVLAAFDSDSGALTRLEMADKVSPDFLMAGESPNDWQRPYFPLAYTRVGRSNPAVTR
jgi:hypothetical protein